MRPDAITGRGRRAALPLLLLPLAAYCQAPDCLPNTLVGHRAGETATLTICSVPLRRDPAFVALVERLNGFMGRGDEMAASIRRLAPALNGATRGLTTAQVTTLAGNLAQLLDPALQQGNDRTLRELEALRSGMDSVRQQLARLATSPQGGARLQAALAGDAGDAIANLDFRGAGETIEQLARIEQKVDALANPPQAEALLPMEVQQAEMQWRQFIRLRGEQRCPTVHEQIVKLRAAAQQAEDDRQFEGARRLQISVRVAAMSAAQHLLYEEQQRQRDEQLLTSQRNSIHDLIDEFRQQLAGRETQLAQASKQRTKRREELVRHHEQQLQMVRDPKFSMDGRWGSREEYTEAAVLRRFEALKASDEWPDSPTSYLWTEETRQRTFRDRERAALDHLQAEFARAEVLAPKQGARAAALLLQDAMRDARRLRDGKPLQPSTTLALPPPSLPGCY